MSAQLPASGEGTYADGQGEMQVGMYIESRKAGDGECKLPVIVGCIVIHRWCDEYAGSRVAGIETGSRVTVVMRSDRHAVVLRYPKVGFIGIGIAAACHGWQGGESNPVIVELNKFLVFEVQGYRCRRIVGIGDRFNINMPLYIGFRIEILDRSIDDHTSVDVACYRNGA